MQHHLLVAGRRGLEERPGRRIALERRQILTPISVLGEDSAYVQENMTVAFG
jgi:hypothetical protein